MRDMLAYNELPTAFPWYDKLEKQQRFRENARQACDYRLISPYNALLPFQFRVEYTQAENIFDQATVFVEDSALLPGAGEVAEETGSIRTQPINIANLSEIRYRVGSSTGTLVAFFDQADAFISETTIPGTEGTITKPAGAEHMIMNVSQGNANLWPRDKLVFALSAGEIPELTPGPITSWKIFTPGGDTEIDVSNNILKIGSRMLSDGLRYYYSGENLQFQNGGAPVGLDMTPGAYYSVVEFADGRQVFSEVFTIPAERFANGGNSRYMRLDFWNSCDINPIMYSAPGGGWKQYMYIDSYIYASEPEVEEDGERDDNDMLVPTFQRMVVRYRFSAPVPDYMKIALVSMQIHDHIYITTERGIRSGRIERVSTSSTIADNGAYSILDVVLDQDVLVKQACCDNMPAIEIQ